MGLNKQVKIILIETSNSGNIGSTLRAMKTMGFGSLCLVNPKEFPSEEVTALSANASDLIDSVQVVNSLEEALDGCNLVIGTSSRDRKVPWPNESIASAAPYHAKVSGMSFFLFLKIEVALLQRKELP